MFPKGADVAGVDVGVVVRIAPLVHQVLLGDELYEEHIARPPLS